MMHRTISVRMFLSYIILLIFVMTVLLPIPSILQALMMIISLLSICIIIHNQQNLIKVIFFILVFQQALLKYCQPGLSYSLINYFDDFVGIILFFTFINKLCKKKIILLNVEKIILICQIIFVLCGLVSSIVYRIQPLSLSLSDSYICSKFVVYYFGARAIFGNKIATNFLYKNYNTEARNVAVLFFLLGLNDFFLHPIFKTYEYRYFGNSIGLMFPHPTYLAVACCTFIFILVANMKYAKKNIYFILMLSIITILTFRTKAIASILVILLMYLLFVKFKVKSKILLGAIGAFGIYKIAYDQFDFYFVTLVSARFILMRDGIKLAQNYFPLGTGFGTFGSNIAATYYSPLYYKLGYASIMHMSPGNIDFLSDTFWPIVITQAGFIGSVFFVLVVAFLTVLSFKVAKKDIYSCWALISIMAYELISSSSESAFFNPSVPPIFILFSIIVTQYIIRCHGVE